MSTWMLEPRDTLIIRDGRPLREGSPPMRSLDSPWPSTLAGLVRTRVGTNASGKFTLRAEEARRIAVRGPLLAQLKPDGSVLHYLLPAPRDCIWHRSEENRELLERRRLIPQPTPSGCATDLGDRMLVGFSGEIHRRKATVGPMFWRWEELEQWLLTPPPPDQVATLDADFGHRSFIHERRTHVSIDPVSRVVSEGQLFFTDGLRMQDKQERLGITFACDDKRLGRGMVQCGGERRLSFLRSLAGSWPAPPKALALAADRLARVLLLTPALFDEGHAPGAVAGAQVVACAVPRAEAISGWDLEHSRPKPTRLMAPAGSVYWVKVDPKVDAQRWASELWMKCISDREQDRLDGFGLCVVGVA